MIGIKLDGGFIGLDDELASLIDMYDLKFNRRKNYEEGWIEDKEWVARDAEEAWLVAQDFAKEWYTFDVSIIEDMICIKVK